MSDSLPVASTTSTLVADADTIGSALHRGRGRGRVRGRGRPRTWRSEAFTWPSPPRPPRRRVGGGRGSRPGPAAYDMHAIADAVENIAIRRPGPAEPPPELAHRVLATSFYWHALGSATKSSVKHYIKSEYGAAQISDAPGVGRGSMRGMGAAFEIGFEQKWDAAKLCKFGHIDPWLTRLLPEPTFRLVDGGDMAEKRYAAVSVPPSRSPAPKVKIWRGATGGDSDSGDAFPKCPVNEGNYFRHYGYVGLHRGLLSDAARMRAYRTAILGNRHLFEGKTVLDVGCGAGILSMLAAQAGASHVYAVDASPRIAEVARQVVAANGELASRITVISGAVETVSLPPEAGKVDVIVSEWMGYGLLYESMLKSVLCARDRFLKEGVGRIYPSLSRMWVCGMESASFHRARFRWSSDMKYTVDFSDAEQMVGKQVLLDYVDRQSLVTSEVQVGRIDLEDRQEGEEIRQNTVDSLFSVATRRDCHIHGLVLYFDVQFVGCEKEAYAYVDDDEGQWLELDTSPFSPKTHWRQCIMLFKNPLSCAADQYLRGRFRVRPTADVERALEFLVQIGEADKRLDQMPVHKYYLM